ncbi:MAG: pyridoxamine 5'-phosphate oxidase [candidate division KSB1 bacterium]|nr:pyridoxamine 5'-phosphate oxidase [candidate division KSB1 bacterium]
MQAKSLPDDPLTLFRQWYAEAEDAEADPTPMALATADQNGRPAVRIVLLKGFDERGFQFFTNIESRKGRELRENPRAALCFFWPNLLRQVRIEGVAELVSDEEADQYFASRPRERQLAAWASQQSEPLASREELLHRYREFEAQFEGKTVPRPPFWSGYRVVPDLYEFWIGHEDRLNERFLYVKENGQWTRTLLNP